MLWWPLGRLSPDSILEAKVTLGRRWPSLASTSTRQMKSMVAASRRTRPGAGAMVLVGGYRDWSGIEGQRPRVVEGNMPGLMKMKTRAKLGWFGVGSGCRQISRLQLFR